MATFGQGSSMLGDTSGASAALQSQRFGDSVSPLSQVSGGSPFYDGATPPPPVTGSALPQGMEARQQPMQMGGGPSPEAEIILKSMAKRLDTIGKI